MKSYDSWKTQSPWDEDRFLQEATEEPPETVEPEPETAIYFPPTLITCSCACIGTERRICPDCGYPRP